MKKVLLINTNTEKAPYPVAPLGLILVAKQLENKFETLTYDAVVDNGQQLKDILLKFNPDYIGISIRNIDNVTMKRISYYYPEIIEKFIAVCRSHSAAGIILGGSGFSLFPEEILRNAMLNFGVIGEGEVSFPLLLHALESGANLDTIDGIIYRSGDTFRINPPKKLLTMEQSAHSKIYDVIDYSPYQIRGSYPVQTKRGCKYDCVYCSYPILEGKTYRIRTPENIVDEIQDARSALGDEPFEFVDSTFNSPAGHAEAICREIIKRNLKVRLRTMGINPEHTGKELFSLMKQAGFSQIDCTPDTASPAILKTMRKNFTLSMLRRCAGLIRTFEMPSMWFFMFGGPGETPDTVLETFTFIDDFISPQDLVYIGEGIRILPNTGLYDIALKENFVTKNGPMLDPVFYVSPTIGRENLSRLLSQEIVKRKNVVHAHDCAPSPAMLQEAMALRAAQGLQEPMFRTLLRLKNKYS